MKYPVFGYEKPYFENIKSELEKFYDEAFYDDFDNLILKKNNKNSKKDVLIAIYASENAFLVSDIKDDGKIDIVSLFKMEDTITNQRVSIKNKLGFIRKKDESFMLDFGTSTKKASEKITKCGDTLYIKSDFEALGDFYFTNEKAYALKNIMTSLIKNEYPYNITFAFLREKGKGAFALGKNLKSDYAFFLTLTDESKEDVSYLKKEKSYISSFETNLIPCHISENILSYADSYYLAGGSSNAVGLAIKCETLENGTFKFKKSSIDKLNKFFNNF